MPMVAPVVEPPAVSHAVDVVGGALGGGVVAAFFGWLRARAKMPADRESALNDFQRVVNGQVMEMIGKLQSQIKGLQEDVERLTAENNECRGENNNMKQKVESLERALKRAGVDLPEGKLPPGSMVEFDNGCVTVKSPGPRKRRP